MVKWIKKVYQLRGTRDNAKNKKKYDYFIVYSCGAFVMVK